MKWAALENRSTTARMTVLLSDGGSPEIYETRDDEGLVVAEGGQKDLAM
jgi:hypothetical protein